MKIESTNETETLATILGCDLGQAADNTTCVVVEKVKVTKFDTYSESRTAKVDLNDPLSSLEPNFKRDIEFHVRYAERVRLGTSYADIVKHIYALYVKLQNRKPFVVIDASGVGRSVLDMLIEAGINESRIYGITATGGETISEDGVHMTVPKTQMHGLLKALFGKGILKIAKGIKEANALERELNNFLIKRTKSSNVQLEAASGEHDDLISALALAVFIADREETVPLIAPVEIRKSHSDGLRFGSRMKRSSSPRSPFGQRWI